MKHPQHPPDAAQLSAAVTRHCGDKGYVVDGPETDKHGYLNFEVSIPDEESGRGRPVPEPRVADRPDGGDVCLGDGPGSKPPASDHVCSDRARQSSNDQRGRGTMSAVTLTPITDGRGCG